LLCVLVRAVPNTQASLLFDFDELHGVETLGALYDASQSVLGTYRKLEGDLHELPEDSVPITFHHADFLQWDWQWAGLLRCPLLRCVLVVGLAVVWLRVVAVTVCDVDLGPA